MIFVAQIAYLPLATLQGRVSHKAFSYWLVYSKFGSYSKLGQKPDFKPFRIKP